MRPRLPAYWFQRVTSIDPPAELRSLTDMLDVHRRYFGVAAFALLALPLAVGLAAPDDSADAVRKEGRRPAPIPSMPESADDWFVLPAKIDAYLKDHFGLREAMIRLERDVTAPLAGSRSDSVMVGRDGRMFLLLQDAVKQSAGIVLRDERVGGTADFLARVRDEMARRGVRFLVALPPNASTIYQEDLPLWAQSRGRTTEYDLLLTDLAKRGVTAVDLRPPLLRLKSEAPAYLAHDSHWTPRGALKGFNAIVSAAGHPDWRIDPAAALGPLTLLKGGDLARMLGVEDQVSESVEKLTLPAGDIQELSAPPFATYVETSGKPGPTIMIIGDSFTGAHLEPMVLQHAGRVVWLAAQHCGFDWAAIDRFRPDEVWWMPNERFLICDPGVRPLDFAGQEER